MEDVGFTQSAGDSTSTSTSRMPRTISESQFTCPCCYQLMLEPTTLNCGHSFCRYCLAKWTETSQNKTCPECRQAWVGKPSVNFTLRETISSLFPEQYLERQSERAADYVTKLQQFDAQPSRLPDAVNDLIPGYAFIGGVLLALLLVLVSWLFYWLGSPNFTLLVHKPVTRWTPTDVSDWMTDLGPWAEVYAQDFVDSNIDGYLLLALTEDDLVTKFNMTNLERRAFILSISNVKELGVKLPTSLWEYKELYPRNFFFFMSTVQVLPRTLFFYTYTYHYDDAFLPFIHAVTPQNIDLSLYHRLPPPTRSQWLSFLPATVYLPYLIIAKFAWLWFSIHYITVVLVTVICVDETFQEATNARLFYRSLTRGRPGIAIVEAIKTYARSIFGQCVFYFIWSFTPWIFCEVYFYFCVYILPMQTALGWLKTFNMWIRNNRQI